MMKKSRRGESPALLFLRIRSEMRLILLEDSPNEITGKGKVSEANVSLFYSFDFNNDHSFSC
jgi:hypothetical protein